MNYLESLNKKLKIKKEDIIDSPVIVKKKKASNSTIIKKTNITADKDIDKVKQSTNITSTKDKVKQ